MNIFRQVTANNIEVKAHPFLREIVMQAYLIENEDILKLDDSNFSEVSVLEAEVTVKDARKDEKGDGRIDLIASYGIDYLAMIELKVGEINKDSLSQLEDYLKARNKINLDQFKDLNSNEVSTDENNNRKWVGVLVGTSISPDLQKKIQNGETVIDGIPVAAMVLKRFRSQHNEIFVITDTYFNFNYSSKDYSKFKFQGEAYNKSRLVNKVIRSYVELNPSISYQELIKTFPDSLQGNKGVIKTLESAEEIYDKTGYKRHYLKPEEQIRLSEVTIVTSTQWGIGNIDNFVKRVNSLDNFERINIVNS